MIGTDAKLDAFLSEHRWGVLTTLRVSGQPVSSVVAYARQGDSLVVSTPADRFKTLSIERDPRVNFCAITNAEPFNFVAVEAHAQVERENLEAATQAVFDAIAGTGYEAPEDLALWIREDNRVILRLDPVRVYGVIR